MGFSFNYFVLILMFDHCWGASQLISTAVYSRPTQYRRLNSADPLSTGATNYYPIEAIAPNNPTFEEIQYSASSSAQPSVELSNDNIRNVAQNRQNVQKRVSAQVDTVKLSNVKHTPTRGDQRPNLPSKARSAQLQANPIRNTHQKSTVLTNPKAQNSGAPISPNYYQMSTSPKPVVTARNNRPELNSTFVRIPVNRFGGPKFEQKTNKNQQTLHKTKPQTSQIQSSTQIQTPAQPQQWTPTQQNQISKRQKFGESQQNYRYDSTHRPETTQSPTFEREMKPSESYREVTLSTNMNVKDSEEKKDVSLVDSESNYQTEYYDSEKTINQNYDQNEQINEQINSYGSPINENNELVSLPESEANYIHSESEPESETTGVTFSESDKVLLDGPIVSKSGTQLKPLLEQFIKQLDHLKIMATKELYKSNENHSLKSKSKSDEEVVQQKITEPLVSKSSSPYHDYQNYEQDSTNTESTNYRDIIPEATGIYEERSDYYPNNSYQS